MRTLNLGILAHVDAGKTSLTERLLYAAGVIDEIGSVDDGSTQTDSLALERRRGITIKSAVVSFAIEDVTVNLIDTPGHPDFIAEVERVLSVLDGAVLVISAVEGVQAQTRVLMRTLQRLRIPTLLFVNKIDRAGARETAVLAAIEQKLTRSIAAMGSARQLGTRGAGFILYREGDDAFTARLADVLAASDDELLAAYVNDEAALTYRRLRDELAAQTRRALVHPVFFGSAVTGAGVDALTAGIRELLPAAQGDADGPVSGTVFKVERGPAGEKIAFARLFSGTVRARDRLRIGPERERCGRRGGERRGDGRRGDGRAAQTVTAISVFDRGSAVPRASVAAGQIGKLWGLSDVRIGDTLGVKPAELAPRRGVEGGSSPLGLTQLTDPAGRQFAPPTLETVVVPCRPADKGALHVALAQLAEQDPLINLRRDDVRQEILVSLYGEVQKEVVQATLADEFGIDVGFRETTTICIERPAGSGSAVEMIGVKPNPFLAGIGLRVDPGPIGSGVEFRLEIELGALPFSFLKAVEETVREALGQGIYGWQVTDCAVTMTHSGYWPRQSHAHGTFDKSMSSTAGDFRNLTPLVLMTALARAGTRVHEPWHRFRLEAPADALTPLLALLARLHGVPQVSRRGAAPPGVRRGGGGEERSDERRGKAVPVKGEWGGGWGPGGEPGDTAQALQASSCVLDGEIPAARVRELEQQLPALTRGEGVLETAFERYQPVRGPVPERPRSDHNPLDRKEYLLHVARRMPLGRLRGDEPA